MLSIAVVIVNWNGRAHLQKCLDSVRSQKCAADVRVFVVDNGSKDGSVAFVNDNYPEVTTIVEPTNVGFAAACNAAIGMMGTDAVVLLNNDATIDESWLCETKKALEGDPSVGIVGGPIFFFEAPSRVWSFGAFVDGLTGLSWSNTKIDSPGNDLTFDALSGCTVMIRRNLIEELGGLDEGYFLYSEDIDLCVNAARLGYRLALVPLAKSWHEVSATARLVPGFAYTQKLKSDMRFGMKNLKAQFIPFSLFVNTVILPLVDLVAKRIGVMSVPAGLVALEWNLRNARRTFRLRARLSGYGSSRLRLRMHDLARAYVDRY